MPVPNERDMNDAVRFAGSAAALSEAALDLKRTLLAVTQNPGPRNNLGLSILESKSGIVLNFGIATAHTPVEAVFDHAFKGDAIVGRYQFFTVKTSASGAMEASEVWTVLFDANCQATWDPKGDFEWSFRPGDPHAPVMAKHFLLTLLGTIQKGLPRY
jgi:hypothetical protein